MSQKPACSHIAKVLAGCLVAATGVAAVGGDESPVAALRRVRAAEQRRVETFARASQAVVAIFASPEAQGGGSGVLISPDGYGLTNFHVVREFLEQRAGVGGLSDGRLYALKLLGIDPGGDVAMFKLQGRETFPYAPLGDSDALRVGQWAAAMGNPFILAEDYHPTITLGIISGLHRYQEGENNLLEYADCIQVSSSINPGNSGGPLFDMQGRVVGINGRGSFEERGRVNVGLGYAISINQIERFIPGLRAGKLMEHATLGVQVQSTDEPGVIVAAIQAGSPAREAGIELGDVILRINERQIRTANDFNNFINTFPADWPVTVTYQRDGVVAIASTELERLPVASAVPFLLDIETNQTEMREIWRGAGLPIGDPEGGEAGLVVGGPNGTQDWYRLVADEPPAVPEAGRWAAAPDAYRRFLTALQPLVFGMSPEQRWEYVGGTRDQERIVHVIRREFGDGVTVSYYFAMTGGNLVALHIEAPGEDAREVWRPAVRRGAKRLEPPVRFEPEFGESVKPVTLKEIQIPPRPPGSAATQPAESTSDGGNR